MSISAINSATNSVAFTGAKKPVEGQEAKISQEKPVDEKAKMSTGKKVAIAAAALATLAVAGIALKKTGKLDTILNKFKKGTDAVNGDTKIESEKFKSLIGLCNTKKMEKTIAEFGPDGTRAQERIASGYEKALESIFTDEAIANPILRDDVMQEMAKAAAKA